MVKVAINGLGRIGRPTLRRILEKFPKLEVEAVNDLADEKTLAHLLKYDSNYGFYDKPVRARKGELLVGNKVIKAFTEKDPLNLPWRKLGIDIVLECSGAFTDELGSKKHLSSGAKKVIISAPSPSKEIPVFVPGVNENAYQPKKHDIVSLGSCTTNCLAPVARVLNENLTIVQGFMTTVHSYTNDQRILDLPHSDLRRARAAALNIIPTTTGAALTIGKVLPELEGKLDGLALRVPTPTVSILDLVCRVKKKKTKQALNKLFEKASQTKELKGILAIENLPLVSSDFKGNCFSAIVDSELTMVKEDLVKVVAWYDNEWAYSCRLAEFADFVGREL